MYRLAMVLLSLIVATTLVIPTNLAAKDVSKVAYIDLAKIFDQYSKTRNSDKDLEEEWEGKKGEIEKMKEEIIKLKDELALLSESAKEKKQENIDRKIRELQDFTKEAKDELTSERNEMVRMILSDIDSVIVEYGKTNSYDLILNERILLYHDDTLDLTDEIIKILNAKDSE